jgi:hypothetical protein
MSFGKTKTNQSGTSAGQDTTSGTTNFNQSTAPTNPDWVSNLAQSLGGNVSSLAANGNPQQYIAAPTPLLTTAANSAGDLNGTPWSYSAANDVASGVANAKAPSIAGNIPALMSPHTDSVVNSTLADFDHNAGLTRAQQSLNLTKSGAFGGSGAALTQAATEDNLARARATTDSGLRQAGYTQALGAATSQAQLQQQQQAQRLAASQAITSNANSYGANQRANISTQDAAAQPIQQIQQAGAQAPLDFQTMLTQMFSGLPLSLFQGQTQDGTQVQNGTENQTGSTTGNSTGFSFSTKK